MFKSYCSKFEVQVLFSWTDQQRVAAAREGWQYRLVFSARMVCIHSTIHEQPIPFSSMVL